MPPKKSKKEDDLKKKEEELRKKEEELRKKEEVLQEKKEVVDKKKDDKEGDKKTDKKKLTAKEKEKIIKHIKEKYKNEKFYCVAERKKGVCIECVAEVDMSRIPYRIIGTCMSCKKSISKYISSDIEF